MKKKPIAALIYDFDGTLSPGNMQEFGFIQAVGKSPEEFWKMSENVAKGQEASQILCYMKLMLDEAAKSGIDLSRDTFVGFGKKIELFEGVRGWFSLINEYGNSVGVNVEHYINSSGLTEIIEGSPIGREFKKIFACSYMYDAAGMPVWPAVAVDFTNKTQFLFKINKGIMSIRDSKKINESQPEESKPVPFTNMIYFGDGMTDIPCMKIVKMFGGNSIAVYPSGQDSGQAADMRAMLNERRVNFICPADYRKDGEIYRVVTAIIDKIKSDSDYLSLQRSNSRKLGRTK